MSSEQEFIQPKTLLAKLAGDILEDLAEEVWDLEALEDLRADVKLFHRLIELAIEQKLSRGT